MNAKDVCDADLPISLKVAASFGNLKAAADQLNVVSSELGKSISALDAAIQRLNLGILAWVNVAGHSDEQSGEYWTHELGYAKVGPKWGISLRARSGNEYTDEVTRHDEWLFNEAPRALRIKAVDKLPELLEKLTQEANSTANKIKAKINYAQQVAEGIAASPRAMERSVTAEIGRAIEGLGPAIERPASIGPAVDRPAKVGKRK